MNIIIGVAAHAVVGRILELVGGMAAAASCRGVHADQRERRQVMIECDVCMPFHLAMTGGAVVGHLPTVAVVQRVTTTAAHRQFFGSGLLMAGRTVQSGVTVMQGKIRR